ncbi:hypothetical protein QE152_g27784 [Popillia japonica]|uniref:Integrase catalytic domain-containing protein n=1 Tax=Popillia japonica TaxID=7064 RepID=A0AAW1JNF1_POPJA
MALIGTIEPFKGNPEEFESYLERIEHLFKVNVVLEDMKVSMFITLAGSSVYQTLKNLAAPRKPVELTYPEVTSLLSKHYAPPVSEIYERFIFNKCVQKSDQSIAEYIVELQECILLGCKVVIPQGTNITQTIEKLKLCFSVIGLPDMIVSDNGPPFNSADFAKFCQMNGISLLKSPPYHPQSNGSAERHVQIVKSALREEVLVGNLGPYVKEKWQKGVILKIISAVTYLVKSNDKIVYKHVNSLRKCSLRNENQPGPPTIGVPITNVDPMTEVTKINSENVPAAEKAEKEVPAAEKAEKESVKVNDTVSKVPKCSASPRILTNDTSETTVRRSTRIRKPPQKLDL